MQNTEAKINELFAKLSIGTFGVKTSLDDEMLLCFLNFKPQNVQLHAFVQNKIP